MNITRIIKKRIWVIAPLLLVATLGLLYVGLRPAPESQAAIAAFNFQVPSDLPRYNWRVCEDLGVGPVPGVPDNRQRFRLCHNQGWELLTYCLQPSRPAPSTGTICSRTNDDTFWCGNGIQNLRTYRVLQTPAPTSTPTNTPIPTSTPTPTSTGTSAPPAEAPSRTPRQPAAPSIVRAVQPGGIGAIVSSKRIRKGEIQPTPTKTPFQPLPITPTPTQLLHPTQIAPTETSPEVAGPTLNFYGIDFRNHKQKVRIQIIPPNKKVNGGKPIVLSFIPGRKCNFGDGRACVNSYLAGGESETIFLTVHSGVGGEGQAYRHAVEGTAENQAGIALNQVRANLRALAGAEVIISQGNQVYSGFTLVVTSRIPARKLQKYFHKPIESALAYAASLEPALESLVEPGQPQLVFETCGWQMPGEAWAPGVSSTTFSVYLGVIQAKQ